MCRRSVELVTVPFDGHRHAPHPAPCPRGGIRTGAQDPNGIAADLVCDWRMCRRRFTTTETSYQRRRNQARAWRADGHHRRSAQSEVRVDTFGGLHIDVGDAMEPRGALRTLT